MLRPTVTQPSAHRGSSLQGAQLPPPPASERENTLNSELLHYAVRLESLDIEARGTTVPHDSVAVVINVPLGRVSFVNTKGADSADSLLPNRANTIHVVEADTIVLLERDALYLKCLKIVAKKYDAIAQGYGISVMTLCTESHDARDTCFQLINAVRPNFAMWCPESRLVEDSVQGQTSLLVEKNVALPMLQGGAFLSRVHCSLFDASEPPFLPQVLAETMLALGTTKSAIHCICLKNCSEVAKWEASIESTLDGFVKLSRQSVAVGNGSSLVLLLYTTPKWLTGISHIEKGTHSTKPGVGRPQGHAVAVSLRMLETSLCFVASTLPEGGGERRKVMKKFFSNLQVGNPEIDIINQFDHLLWLGDYEEEDHGVMTSPPVMGTDNTGVWFRSLGDPAIGLSYAYSESVPSYEHPPLAVVYELPAKLPFLSVFHKTAPLLIEIEHIELHCRGVPSLDQAALVMYPTGPFCSYAGSKVKPIERGRGKNTWERGELPRLHIAAGYTVEYLRRQLLHVALRDVAAEASCNLVGVATLDLSSLPKAEGGGMVELKAKYCRYDRICGDISVVLRIRESTATPMGVGVPLRYSLHDPEGRIEARNEPEDLGNYSPSTACSPYSHREGSLSPAFSSDTVNTAMPGGATPMSNSYREMPRSALKVKQPPQGVPPQSQPRQPVRAPSPSIQPYQPEHARSLSRTQTPPPTPLSPRHQGRPLPPPPMHSQPCHPLPSQPPVHIVGSFSEPYTEVIEEVPMRYTIARDAAGRVGMAVGADMRVAKVSPEGPAEAVGVRPGMRVCAVAGKAVDCIAEYYNVLGSVEGAVGVMLCAAQHERGRVVKPERNVERSPRAPERAQQERPHRQFAFTQEDVRRPSGSAMEYDHRSQRSEVPQRSGSAAGRLPLQCLSPNRPGRPSGGGGGGGGGGQQYPRTTPMCDTSLAESYTTRGTPWNLCATPEEARPPIARDPAQFLRF